MEEYKYKYAIIVDNTHGMCHLLFFPALFRNHCFVVLGVQWGQWEMKTHGMCHLLFFPALFRNHCFVVLGVQWGQWEMKDH
ncbi:hypothetical protein E2562_038620 [Oryza meyeriana var. granulata]|uniref:Uncharacterized protein n=1 Tax=Oryza meyeriana var. granulata TaxID=110450 RepID=A0A6G1E7L5_9ORYZ|nr:hypothetical protein E2562_038620 [Oryza meyeriana var. granulata]